MLRALDDLERAINQLVEKTRGNAPGGDLSGSTEASVVKAVNDRTINRPDQVNEDAAELIRRAIKRLKSL